MFLWSFSWKTQTNLSNNEQIPDGHDHDPKRSKDDPQLFGLRGLESQVEEKEGLQDESTCEQEP